jgi:hypothetical protein
MQHINGRIFSIEKENNLILICAPARDIITQKASMKKQGKNGFEFFFFNLNYYATTPPVFPEPTHRYNHAL